MGKATKTGCFGCLLTIMALIFTLFLIVGGGFYWLYLQYTEDPGFWYKNYPGLTRTVASLILSPINSADTLDIPEVEFSTELYDSFMQKQTTLVSVFQNKAIKNQAFSGSLTDKEVMNFFMSELANYGIRHYKLTFLENHLVIQASVPAQSLKEYMPKDLPEIAYQIYDSIQYLNFEMNLLIAYKDGQFEPFEIKSLKPGNINIPEVVLEKITEFILSKKTDLEQKINQDMANNSVKLETINFREGSIDFTGLWNIN